MVKLFRLLLGSLAILAVLSVDAARPRAELLITPKRIILDESSRDAVFRLVNRSTETRTYELAWRQMRMAADGSLEDAGDAAPGGADRLVMVAPMRVTLAPGGRQTVRVSPRLPDSLPEGEYMSHLMFRPVDGKADTQSGTASSMRLQVRLGFSVPVIVRHGALDSQVQVQPVGIDSEAGTVTIALMRTGGTSTYGNIELYWGQPQQVGIQVGRLDGVAVYANLGQRQLTLPFTPPAGVQIGPGMLTVRYVDPEANMLLDEASVTLR